MVMIFTNYNGLSSLVLHTTFHRNVSMDLREKTFKGFAIYGHDGHLGHVT